MTAGQIARRCYPVIILAVVAAFALLIMGGFKTGS